MLEPLFIDVAAEPDKLFPLPPGTINASLLQELALGALSVAGATPEAILTLYEDSPLLWPLPPRLSYAGRTILNAQVATSDRVSGLIELHRDCRKDVKIAGVGPLVLSNLASVLGPKVGHPLVFTQTEPSEEAANLFSIEFILATGAGYGNLEVQDLGIKRSFKNKREGLQELKLSVNTSKALTWEWLEQVLYSSRGSVLYTTYDIFDRCYSWLQANAHPSEMKPAELALSWLKVLRSKSVAYDFEQRVRGLEPVEALPTPTDYPNLLYTVEALDLAKDIWFDQSLDTHEAFRDFYDFLVPSYLDDLQFRRLFKTGMVLKGDFTDEIRKKVDAGILNFSAWFMRTMRKVNK